MGESALKLEERGKKVDFISKIMLDNLTFDQGCICRLKGIHSVDKLKLVFLVKNCIFTNLFS